ncbi:hypothetical protein D3C78_1100600 [compost metagenome]
MVGVVGCCPVAGGCWVAGGVGVCASPVPFEEVWVLPPFCAELTSPPTISFSASRFIHTA